MKPHRALHRVTFRRSPMASLLSAIGARLGSLAYRLGLRTKVTNENLKFAFSEASPEKLKAVAIGAYRNLGTVFAEMLLLRFADRSTVQQGMLIHNRAEIEAAIRAGHGVILLSAHLANWEWMALATGLELSRSLDVVVKNQSGKISENFLQKMRTRLGNRTVNAGDVKGIFRVLYSGGILAMLGDQAAPLSSVAVPFFGRSVPTYEGPARLALRTHAAIFLAECSRRSPGSYEMEFHSIDYADLPGPDADSVRELTRRHTAKLEAIIRAAPELWLWQHRRWKNAQ